MPLENVTEKRVVVTADPAALAAGVAARFIGKVSELSDAGRTVHVSLTGGTSGIAVLRAAAEHPWRDNVDWSLVHFWWSDERFVPSGHADRNDAQAREALLDALAIPAENIHPMPASDQGVDLDAAAVAYAQELSRFSTDDGPWPVFDICFLGVGPDGHIASLFPDRPEIHVTSEAVLAVRDSPKPPPERITLTRPVINSSVRVWMVIAGADKASALGLVLAGASYSSVPAAGAKGRRRTVIFVDKAAAAEVPPDLIDPDY
ncbi:MAG TPA: 6-phosphogluconolactonase [Microbacterium sp.]|uniref:6-phosphogluconolactonase n=1 Tax=Microbacterium sp. TaxID=51671 RepID=UPI002B6EF6C3|nr:6-phosphogluconolactonase [Microbacterium sp.]HWI30829.1 6-phosphogluconolactonase [Microbacterium sp.]